MPSTTLPNLPTVNTMDQPAFSTPPVGYKDRSTGLMIFGILTVLLGALCALLVPLMVFAQSMAPAGQADQRTLIPAIVMYGGLAVVLITLGIGSIRARRWGRALMLIFSWSWLIMGIISIAFMALLLPKMSTALQAGDPPSQHAEVIIQNADGTTQTSEVKVPKVPAVVMIVIPLLFMSVFFVALPAVWVFFYRSPHVKATCEARDPVRRWTDACPLPVLALSLWMAFSAVASLAAPLGPAAILPFFGSFLTGVPGTVGFLVLAGVWAWSAWALYRLQASAWWIIVAIFAVLMVSHIMTYSRHSLTDIYDHMGYPPQQIERMKALIEPMGGLMTWGMLAFALPFVGYMIYVKKFFRAGHDGAS